MAILNVVCDPAGDVTLVVGKAKVKIRSSSEVLATGSKDFEKMFWPHFRGGEAVAAGSAEGPLPEDDAGNMTILCRMLHL